MALQLAQTAGLKAGPWLHGLPLDPFRVSGQIRTSAFPLLVSSNRGRLNVQSVLSESPLSSAKMEQGKASAEAIGFGGLHHVGLLCANTERSLDFYCGVLGLEINDDRKNTNLPYGGAWLWVGTEMIHLMELPNPDPITGRPAHGGRDRHACFTINSVEALRQALDAAGLSYTMSKSGRPALFTRDPDGNALEFQQIPK